jgi:hypothetical protein
VQHTSSGSRPAAQLHILTVLPHLTGGMVDTGALRSSTTVRPRYTADCNTGRAIPSLFSGDSGWQNSNVPVSGKPPSAAFLALHRAAVYGGPAVLRCQATTQAHATVPSCNSMSTQRIRVAAGRRRSRTHPTALHRLASEDVQTLRRWPIHLHQETRLRQKPMPSQAAAQHAHESMHPNSAHCRCSSHGAASKRASKYTRRCLGSPGLQSKVWHALD